jgi:ABC-type nickel/cobalt efflux system permease component RcnA
MGSISRTQLSLRRQIARLSRELKDRRAPGALAILLLLAFLFGVVHSAGPGHGKVFIMSYFLADKPSLKKGLLFGNLLAFIHTLSAIILVLVVYYVLRASVLRTVDSVSRILRPVSFGLITLVGVWLLVSHIRQARRDKQTQTAGPLVWSDRRAWSMVLSLGLIPCAGTVVLLLFALSLNAIGLGIVLALVMALGMAVTITAVGLFAILARKGILRATSGRRHVQRRIRVGLEITGSAIIVVVGTILFLSNL